MQRREFLAGVLALAAAPGIARAELAPIQVAASNTGAQGGTPLAYAVNIIMPTHGAGYSVTLPPASGSGQVVEVVNRSGFFVLLYPALGDRINFFAKNVALAVYPTTYLRFVDTGRLQWDFLYNIASTFPVYMGIKAHPGGGQALATALGYGSSVIEVCATADDSARLPIALGAGEQIIVSNLSAAACNLFPVDGERINALAPNAPYSLPAGRTALFTDVGPPNQWVGGVLG